MHTEIIELEQAIAKARQIGDRKQAMALNDALNVVKKAAMEADEADKKAERERMHEIANQ